jgi:hypothetical protein
MIKKLWLALAAGTSLLAMPALAQSSPVVGTWDTAAVTDFGTFKSQITVTEANGSYAVEMKDIPAEGAPADGGGMTPGPISDVVVDGASFSFKRKLTTPQGEMNLAYAGKVDGDKLTAEVDTGQFGKLPVTGTRK